MALKHFLLILLTCLGCGTQNINNLHTSSSLKNQSQRQTTKKINLSQFIQQDFYNKLGYPDTNAHLQYLPIYEHARGIYTALENIFKTISQAAIINDATFKETLKQAIQDTKFCVYFQEDNPYWLVDTPSRKIVKHLHGIKNHRNILKKQERVTEKIKQRYESLKNIFCSFYFSKSVKEIHYWVSKENKQNAGLTSSFNPITNTTFYFEALDNIFIILNLVTYSAVKGNSINLKNVKSSKAKDRLNNNRTEFFKETMIFFGQSDHKSRNLFNAIHKSQDKYPQNPFFPSHEAYAYIQTE